ncbi:glycosyltransferase family 2 protein [Seonamhaeicola sediminis]|uniref:Glycosyltransferase family 2 protein n=1 Tax=Seonamhaeicola sediminis TaxID=2528206 RepID=A0A562YCL8_9FLAO|nr:hypothetical protein [Seonamhaeicola sediminis]TWO31793.1 glycosyltransferase family 2 protein [Seonamhaeicola sediminis]
MDIIIKSFNRVYYLDRCLHSIFLYLQNFKGEIYILDDGSPQIYLDKIQLKFPGIVILKSPNYEEKSKAILDKTFNFPSTIPSKFWYESVLDLSDYFMVLEDDMWFTENCDVSELNDICKNENLALLKLFWVSNPKTVGSNIVKRNRGIEVYNPDLKSRSPKFFKYIYMKYNPIWRGILSLFRLYTKESELQYYTIYSVAGAVFKKDYYLSIWDDAYAIVDEKQQLLNAVQYYNKFNVAFAKVNKEVLKTGFMSSATLKYHYPDFSILDFNCMLNEYWLRNDNAFNNNLSLDLDTNEIINILHSYDKPEAYILQWLDWVNSFKAQFRKIGCNI